MLHGAQCLARTVGFVYHPLTETSQSGKGWESLKSNSRQQRNQSDIFNEEEEEEKDIILHIAGILGFCVFLVNCDFHNCDVFKLEIVTEDMYCTSGDSAVSMGK